MNDVREALRLLGKRKLVLAIHDLSFPSRADEEIGRGTPYSRGAADFLAFVARLGFNGIQLGPQGLTTRDNPSPYDSTLFSRNPLNLALWPLAHDPVWGGLLSKESLGAWVASSPSASNRTRHTQAFDISREALREMHLRFAGSRPTALERAFADFKAKNHLWLESDALYHVLEQRNGGRHYADWPDDPAAVASAQKATDEIEQYELGQLILHLQHQALRQTAETHGLALYGDLQVGYSPRDTWRCKPLLMPHFSMGAPPSRTNPSGQPWGYGVLDPAQYRKPGGADGPVLELVRQRVGRLLDEFDGLRLDHPHGIVCPWVYDARDPDPVHAVQNGARLFSSPQVPDLARYAIAKPSQLDRSQPRHADGWVHVLSPEQVDQYAIIFDTIVAEAKARGRDKSDLICEVLSTQPYPLRRVLERHGLGRFRVTQKADVANRSDVYRSENARPEDWIMMSTHDTPPIWRMAERWIEQGEADRQARYLAARLGCLDAAEVARDARLLVHAKAADLFSSDAENVMVFFADLLGMKEVYNAPGEVLDGNWSLRVPPDYEAAYERDAAERTALDLRYVLALALEARGFSETHPALIERLSRQTSFAGRV